MARKTFAEKLNDSKNLPKIEILTNIDAISRYGGEKMLIAPPIAYDEIMKKVPYGKLITSDKIRIYLAKKYKADFTCPLTAGFFINIVAKAVEEQAESQLKALNSDDFTPFYRTLKKNGELCDKFPGGIDGHRELLEKEGHVIIQKGKRSFVENYEDSLFELK